jgi:hypothetical protein
MSSKFTKQLNQLLHKCYIKYVAVAVTERSRMNIMMTKPWSFPWVEKWFYVSPNVSALYLVHWSRLKTRPALRKSPSMSLLSSAKSHEKRQYYRDKEKNILGK